MSAGGTEAPREGATGIILAGGRSSRMGREKLTLTVGGVTLISRVHDALSPFCPEILVVGDGPDVLPLAARRVRDLRAGREGPLAGLEAGLGAASHEAVFVAAGDMPFLPRLLVGALLDRLRSGRLRAVVPRHGGRVHPLCAAYGRGVRSDATRLLDNGARAARDLLEDLGEGVGYVEGEELARFGDPDVFMTNVNSPEDLARARASLGVEEP